MPREKSPQAKLRYTATKLTRTLRDFKIKRLRDKFHVKKSERQLQC